MDPFLLKLLVLMNALLIISTIVNVIHKLGLINGPNAHIAIAILSIIVLFGYSGVLNTLFLKRRFHRGRIYYLTIAGASQITILILSFLSLYNILSYGTAIAVIHAIMGFIVMVNFTCAVYVVYEQQVEIEEDQKKIENKTLQMKIATLEYLTKITDRSNDEESLKDEESIRQPLIDDDLEKQKQIQNKFT